MKRVYLISIVILVVLIFVVLNLKTTEEFNCYNCGRNDWSVGPKRCLSCYNCGWCENKDGTGSCKVANPNGYGPLFAQDCHKWYQGGRTRVYYNMFPWYNPLRWVYRRWPQIRGLPYVVRHTGPRRWRFSRR